ncbi:hypothetical protein [Mycobacteroides salmoniphilum]|uniref:hypothetical protein n=1 Tax=Mycobacteroides salmoniphilum TaxID=404941 RepID=UPI0010666A16|nr:hypothetical protein [Mycobacteroides salmoniphilum]
MVALRWWIMRGAQDTAGGQQPAVEAPIGTPKGRLIGFALDRQPVPAWQLSQADIGLPPQVRVGNMFAALGDTAYFVAGTGCAGDVCVGPKGWVYGLDIRTGKKVLGPIELNDFWGSSSDDCYSNGPSVAVCVTPECDVIGCDGLKELAWVIDLNRGEITYTGPPGVHAGASAHPELPYLRMIGSSGGETRLVGAVEGKGVYGVGSRLEPTWFLPGSGDVPQADSGVVNDAAPVTLAVQMPDRSIGQGLRVFSADGKDLTPTPPEGLEVGSNVQIYPGGFAVEYQKDARLGGVSLFDTEGNEVVHLPEARFLKPSSAMPIMQSGEQTLVYSAAGKQQISAIAGDSYRSIGTTLYANVGPRRWQSMDLLTGQRGPVCTLDLDLDYVGSDGSTLVWHDMDNKVYTAVDPATCRTRWEIQDHWVTAAQTRLTKASTGLVQVTTDVITGLRAPD